MKRRAMRIVPTESARLKCIGCLHNCTGRRWVRARNKTRVEDRSNYQRKSTSDTQQSDNAEHDWEELQNPLQCTRSNMQGSFK